MAASDNERRTEETPQFPGSCAAGRDTAAVAVAVAANDAVAALGRVAANYAAVGWADDAENVTFAVGSRKREPADDAFDADADVVVAVVVVVVETEDREES